MNPIDISWIRVIGSVGLAAATYVGIGMLFRITGQWLTHRVQDEEDTKRIETLKHVLRYVANTILLVAFALVMLSQLGIAVAPFLGAAGIVGLGIGFAAQSLVKDYFRGMFLLLENQIRIGDTIDVAGKSGTVEEVTLRYVRLRDEKGSVHFVSNGEISTVTNNSVGFSYAVVDVRMPSSVDVDTVIGIMRETAIDIQATEAKAGLLGPFEVVGIVDWQEFAVVVRGRFKARPGTASGIRCAYLKRVREQMLRAGIAPYEPLAQIREWSNPAARGVA